MNARKYGTFVRRGWGFVLFALFSFPFLQPMIRFANPVHLALFGLLTGYVMLRIYDWHVLDMPGRRLELFVIVLGAIACLVTITIETVSASDATDKRCAWLQRKFIDRSIPDANGASAFEALGCRPQFPVRWGR